MNLLVLKMNHSLGASYDDEVRNVTCSILFKINAKIQYFTIPAVFRWWRKYFLVDVQQDALTSA